MIELTLTASGMKKVTEKITNAVAIKMYLYLDKLVKDRWNSNPFGQIPLGDKDKYLYLAKEAADKNYPEVDGLEERRGFVIDSDWLADLALHTQIVVKDSEPSYQHGRVIYSDLSRYLYDHRDESGYRKINILETGTARGFSCLCMAKALADANRAGTIVTIDVLPHNQSIIWNCIDDLDGPSSRSDLLKRWQKLIQDHVIFVEGHTRSMVTRIYSQRIHYAFLDGSHEYDDIWFEFKQVTKSQKIGDKIVFDDYTPTQYQGLVKAADEVCEEYDYQKEVIRAGKNRGYLIAMKR